MDHDDHSLTTKQQYQRSGVSNSEKEVLETYFWDLWCQAECATTALWRGSDCAVHFYTRKMQKKTIRTVETTPHLSLVLHPPSLSFNLSLPSHLPTQQPSEINPAGGGFDILLSPRKQLGCPPLTPEGPTTPRPEVCDAGIFFLWVFWSDTCGFHEFVLISKNKIIKLILKSCISSGSLGYLNLALSNWIPHNSSFIPNFCIIWTFSHSNFLTPK